MAVRREMKLEGEGRSPENSQMQVILTHWGLFQFVLHNPRVLGEISFNTILLNKHFHINTINTSIFLIIRYGIWAATYIRTYCTDIQVLNKHCEYIPKITSISPTLMWGDTMHLYQTKPIHTDIPPPPPLSHSATYHKEGYHIRTFSYRKTPNN